MNVSRLLLILAAVLFALPLQAEARGHRYHDGSSSYQGRQTSFKISVHDRDVIKDYIVEGNREHCPPGLAKKHNGCLPPGQAKKLYHVGGTLPYNVDARGLPQTVLMQLDSPPVGYRYVTVDQDVFLISEASHKIIDAVTLLSAIKHSD